MQQYVANEALRLSEPYIPFDTGRLLQSGHVENDKEIVWKTPYARYQYGGKVWITPSINASGFKTENGWYTKRGEKKIPTNRDLEYQNGPLRGGHWFDRMMQNGGQKHLEEGIRRML